MSARRLNEELENGNLINTFEMNDFDCKWMDKSSKMKMEKTQINEIAFVEWAIDDEKKELK